MILAASSSGPELAFQAFAMIMAAVFGGGVAYRRVRGQDNAWDRLVKSQATIISNLRSDIAEMDKRHDDEIRRLEERHRQELAELERRRSEIVSQLEVRIRELEQTVVELRQRLP